jgi:hypothetical protein
MPDAANERQFSVHARDIDSHHARTLTERSFEAAALAYVEDLRPLGNDAEISVIVRDVASGHVQCFRIDLDTGEKAPCAMRTNLRPNR